MSIKCGIVGLPNVGKSTLFNALTDGDIPASNYPFCTIDPNSGTVLVPDNRLENIAKLVNPKKTIPTIIEFVDIAGLVKGASSGEGLGNQFLSHIRETDAICHVVRTFDDDNIIHVDGKIDPINDITTIETELLLADISILEKKIDKLKKLSRSKPKEFQQELINNEKLLEHLNNNSFARNFENAELICPNLITNKPIIYIANGAENDFKDNSNLDKVKEHASKQNAQVVPICAAFESELSGMDHEEKKSFLEEIGLQQPGLHEIIKKCYSLLGLETYYTQGPQEVRAWTINKNSTAPIAAGKIHSDFERGFISAEIVSYDDFIKYDGKISLAKDHGVWRQEGKDYIVKDGDVILFRFNV